jgi:hypothetical protein
LLTFFSLLFINDHSCGRIFQELSTENEFQAHHEILSGCCLL